MWAIFVLAVVFMSVVAPIWIIAHYVTLWRVEKRRDTLSEAAKEEAVGLKETAEKLDQRIVALEKLLDAELDGWRTK
ncbi:phage shock protein B [Aestuariispira ectoiniformans]|uniref:phage shock protein B n=1 Tax=Aestuariispira ectoiniformans TaxID=2775080 RepID=UPI00223C2E4D|nr:phage shock protein B [Aestuariispira ectoiniformans]